MTDINKTIVSVEFTKHGYNPEARIMIRPEQGTYYVFIRRNEPGAPEIEIPFEPAEPELQKLGTEWAQRDPEAAILQAIEIDRDK